MARKIGKRDNRCLAKLVTENRAPCAFCHREVDDEVTYGKLYAIGDIQCHYYCALLSCCLVQKGPEEEGLFGFMYKDILAELERSKKHKCSFCGRGGANLGCSVSSCRKQFHLPCGRERNAVSQYYGTYKSFCQLHAPKQVIPEHIMCKAKLRMKGSKVTSSQSDEEMVCVICYEAVDAFPTVNTFWPPCCAKDAWFHRSCLQRMTLSAGMHYLKCPLCNDKNNFYDAVLGQGYYVPDRDAAWELEQNAFAEIYERALSCAAAECRCPQGRGHDSDQGMWDIKLCLLCGSVAAHAHCIGASESTTYVCPTCTPAAPDDIQTLADTIEKMIVEEQAATTSSQRGPVMPSRMSLRRTKGRLAAANRPSSSRPRDVKIECESASPQTLAGRQELNLPTPRKLQTTKPEPRVKSPYKSPMKQIHDADKRMEVSYKNVDGKSIYSPNSPAKLNKNGDSYKNELLGSPLKQLYESVNRNIEASYKLDAQMLSPIKLLEQCFNERFCMGAHANLDEDILGMLRNKLKKPGPLRLKKKLVNDILDGFFNNLNASQKQKEELREWCSPKKCYERSEGNLTSENTIKRIENTSGNKENCLHETPKKSTRSNRKSLDKHSEDRNIDLDDSEAKTDREISRNNDEQLNNETPGPKKVLSKEETLTVVECEHKSTKDEDESSNSTFQLPSEFIAETHSDNSNTAFDTPIQKTIDNVFRSNVSDVKGDVSTEALCAFKFSPLDKERLEKNIVDIDLESFKKGYLNEVGKEFVKKCTLEKQDKVDINSIINFVVDAQIKKPTNKPKKRKLSEGKLVLVYDKNDAKKRKLSGNDFDLDLSSGDDFEVKRESKSPLTKKNKKIKVKISPKRRIKNKSVKDKLKKSLRNKNNNADKTEDKLYKLTDNAENKDKMVKKVEFNKHKNVNNADSANKTTKNTIVDKETSKAKRKLHESSQWMNEITQFDKKLEIEAEKKAKKHERNSRNKVVKQEMLEDPAKDKIAKETYDNDNGTEDSPIDKIHKSKLTNNRKSKNRTFKKDEVTAKTNKEDKDGGNQHKPKKLKDTIRKHKREKLLKVKQQKRQNKFEKYKKDKKHREKYKESKQSDQNIELTIDSSDAKSNKRNNKIKTKLSIRNNEKDISVKIKWKKKQLQLKIESKKEKVNMVDNDHSKYKQYVLQYFTEMSPKEVLVKPEKEVSPLKRKYIKQEKSPDKLKQMSIQNFFKARSPKES